MKNKNNNDNEGTFWLIIIIVFAILYFTKGCRYNPLNPNNSSSISSNSISSSVSTSKNSKMPSSTMQLNSNISIVSTFNLEGLTITKLTEGIYKITWSTEAITTNMIQQVYIGTSLGYHDYLYNIDNYSSNRSIVFSDSSDTLLIKDDVNNPYFIWIFIYTLNYKYVGFVELSK